MQSRMSKNRDSWGKGRKHSYWGVPRPNCSSPIPREADSEGGGASPRSQSQVTSVKDSPPGQGPPVSIPTSHHLDRLGSRIHAHVGAGVQGWAHVSGQEMLSSLHGEEGDPRDLEEPPWGSGVGTLGPGLGLSWGGHMQMGQARLATMPSRALHGLGHSSTQAPGLLGVAPTKGPFDRHLLGLLSIFRTLPKPRSLSSPWSGPRRLPTTPTLILPSRRIP